jgi:glycosyltransferase involved in cell wall biosynthesis
LNQPNPDAAKGKERGLNVECALVEDLNYPENYFATVILFHVIEHLASPKNILQKIFHALKPSGRVFITCPNAESYLSKFFAEYWAGWHVPFHFYHFTPQTISKLIGLTDFEIVKLKARTSDLVLHKSLIAFLRGRRKDAKGDKYLPLMRSFYLDCSTMLLFRPLDMPSQARAISASGLRNRQRDYERKRVTAVIVTYNNLLMLSELLRDLQNQTRKADEIIVIDNASSDGTDHLMKRDFPSVRYIRLPENTGSAGGYHEGIKTALENSDLIWTLDDDVRLYPDSLEELLKGLEKLDSKLPVGSVRSVGKRCDKTPPSRLEFFPWRGTLLKTEVIRKIGLPLKELFIYGEDLEFAVSPQFYCIDPLSVHRGETWER